MEGARQEISEANIATSKVTAAEAMQKEMTERLATLEAERQGLVEAKEQAMKDAQAKATELAKLKDDVAGVEVEKEPEPEAAGDDKGKAGAKSKESYRQGRRQEGGREGQGQGEEESRRGVAQEGQRRTVEVVRRPRAVARGRRGPRSPQPSPPRAEERKIGLLTTRGGELERVRDDHQPALFGRRELPAPDAFTTQNSSDATPSVELWTTDASTWPVPAIVNFTTRRPSSFGWRTSAWS